MLASSPATPSRDHALRDPALKWAVIISCVLHAALVIGSIVGMPYMAKDFEVVEMIPVELTTAPVADETRTTKPPIDKPKPKEDKPPEPPKTVKTPPPAPTVVPKAPEPAPAPPEDDLAKPEPDAPKPEPVKKPDPKPAEKKPDITPPEKPPEKAPDTEQDFQSLLKNLSQNQPADQADENNTATGAPTPAPSAPLGDTMTVSELDAVRQQLAQCWVIIAGANAADSLAVDVRIQVNPDRTVREASVPDQSRYNSDPFFRAAADSALRAVNNPACSPLRLPPDKFDTWKTMLIRFDPREMLQ